MQAVGNSCHFSNSISQFFCVLVLRQKIYVDCGMWTLYSLHSLLRSKVNKTGRTDLYTYLNIFHGLKYNSFLSMRQNIIEMIRMNATRFRRVITDCPLNTKMLLFLKFCPQNCCRDVFRNNISDIKCIHLL